MSRQEALEELAASVQIDTAAGVDPEALSIPVYGNVQVAALRALGFYIPEAPPRHPASRIVYACQNCEWEGPEENLVVPIPHLEERVAPGERMPAGECPVCGALCHATSRWLCSGCGEKSVGENWDALCSDCATEVAQ